MKSYCNNMCLRIKAQEQVPIYSYNARNTGVYNNGYKRCQRCNIYLKTKSIKCPCCHFRLRVSNCRSAKRNLTEHARY